MSKQLKQLITKDLEKRFRSLDSYIVVDFQGLDSAKSYDLRRTLHDSGVQLSVVPNRLAARILDRWDGKQEVFRGFFRGPTALVYGKGGAITASKVVLQWKKKNKDLLPVKGGVIEGEVVPPKGVEGLSRIPDRQVLLAQVAGGFQGSLTRLAAVTQAIVAKLVYALDAH